MTRASLSTKEMMVLHVCLMRSRPSPASNPHRWKWVAAFSPNISTISFGFVNYGVVLTLLGDPAALKQLAHETAASARSKEKVFDFFSFPRGC